MNVPSYHMQVETSDGQRWEDDYIYGMVSNTVSVGGLVSLPRDKVLLDDGVFEALLIRQPKNAKDWQNILTALATQKLVEGGPVTGFSAGRVTFTCDKAVSWTLDGEFGGERTVTAIENLPRAFVLAAAHKTAKAPDRCRSGASTHRERTPEYPPPAVQNLTQGIQGSGGDTFSMLHPMDGGGGYPLLVNEIIFCYAFAVQRLIKWTVADHGHHQS